MKTISEVCKQIGVTRRALQVYNDKGLLHPTSKTTGGYWLYDEESVQKLKLILILKEAGYSNKSIKPNCAPHILESAALLFVITESGTSPAQLSLTASY